MGTTIIVIPAKRAMPKACFQHDALSGNPAASTAPALSPSKGACVRHAVLRPAQHGVRLRAGFPLCVSLGGNDVSGRR
jgi:hypothetical protein